MGARGTRTAAAWLLLSMLVAANVQAAVLPVALTKEALDAAYSRHSAVLAGNLFSVLTTFSTLGGLAQGGLAYAAKDIRTQATELLTSTKGLQLAIDKLLLPPGTKLAMKLAAQSMERTAGNLLTLADGKLTGDMTGAMAKLLTGLEKDITDLAGLAPGVTRAFSPFMGDGKLLLAPLAAFNAAAKAALAGAAATGTAAAGGALLLGGGEAGALLKGLSGMYGELKGLDAFLGASNGDAIKGLGDALKAFGVPDSELLDLDKLRQEVRAAINNIDQLAPRMAGKSGSINLNITAPVAQPVTDALKAAAGSG